MLNLSPLLLRVSRHDLALMQSSSCVYVNWCTLALVRQWRSRLVRSHLSPTPLRTSGERLDPIHQLHSPNSKNIRRTLKIRVPERFEVYHESTAKDTTLSFETDACPHPATSIHTWKFVDPTVWFTNHQCIERCATKVAPKYDVPCSMPGQLGTT